MKNKITELEKTLSNKLLEQQVLKSENTLLAKQIQRLTKKLGSNNQISKDNEKYNKKIKQLEKSYLEKKEKLQKKYFTFHSIQKNKIESCERTIKKFEELYSGLCKESVLNTSNTIIENNNVIKLMKCKNCEGVFKPFEYFQHVEESCPRDRYSQQFQALNEIR